LLFFDLIDITMNKFQFQFDVPSFNKLFPFYILIDEKLNIKSCGKALLDYVPDDAEVRFFSFFQSQIIKRLLLIRYFHKKLQFIRLRTFLFV